MGTAVAGAGVAIVLVSIFASPAGFHAPRWVAASAGASLVFFGGWTAALYGLGYDPARGKETLPSPAIQLAVLIPGLLFFAAPFHWVAFGPGPRQFATTTSFLSFALHRPSSGLSGRVFFGIGAILIDLLLVVSAVRLIGEIRRRSAAAAGGPSQVR